jgi:hypothetical protein
MKNIVIFIMLLTINNCAGRKELEILATRPGDNVLDCGALTEFHKNNEALVEKKVTERLNTKQRNQLVMTASTLFFAPLILISDLRDIEKSEILGLKKRNETLRSLAKEKSCEEPPSRLKQFYEKLEGEVGLLPLSSGIGF